jgi:hypothetical protein
VGSIETEDDHLFVKLRATPVGVLESVGALKKRAS